MGEPNGAARSASPRSAAPLVAPPQGGDPTGEPKAASKGTGERRLAEIRTLLETLSGDQGGTKTLALKAGYSESEIAEALGGKADC